MNDTTNIRKKPMVLVLIGPMGSGKTTIGKLLAERTGWRFADADDYHPQNNIAKMAAGISLNDNDRQPWLVRLSELINRALADEDPLILACSALKQSYREILGVDQETIISVYLKGSQELLAKRVGNRKHQYMNKGLLDSQMATMEEPDQGLVVDISPAPEQIVAEIITTIHAKNLTVRT